MLTRYFIQEIPDDLLKAIEKPNVSSNTHKLDLPPKNHLIPRNFEILKLDPKLSDVPHDISIWADTSLWFL